MGFKMETQMHDCLYLVQQMLPAYRKSSYGKNKIMQCKGHNLWATHWILEHWHSVWQSWEICKSSHQSTNHQDEQLNNLHLQCTYLFYSIFLLGMLISASFEQESQESILFHPVPKANPTCHSWIITAHISLGDLEKQWKMFIQQKARSQQLLNSL